MRSGLLRSGLVPADRFGTERLSAGRADTHSPDTDRADTHSPDTDRVDTHSPDTGRVNADLDTSPVNTAHLLATHCLNTRSSYIDLRVRAVRPALGGPRVDGLHDRFRCGWGDFVAPGALGAGQEEVLVLGGGFREVVVGGGCGNARPAHRACVLRQPLARDLAGVGHAYPSPIG
ncbi:hypothetical protein ACVNF4_03380 [Streptomyces sp. S6]